MRKVQISEQMKKIGIRQKNRIGVSLVQGFSTFATCPPKKAGSLRLGPQNISCAYLFDIQTIVSNFECF